MRNYRFFYAAVGTVILGSLAGAIGCSSDSKEKSKTAADVSGRESPTKDASSDEVELLSSTFDDLLGKASIGNSGAPSSNALVDSANPLASKGDVASADPGSNVSSSAETAGVEAAAAGLGNSAAVDAKVNQDRTKPPLAGAGNSTDVNLLLARLNDLQKMQLDAQTKLEFKNIQEERAEKAQLLLQANPSYDFRILGIKNRIDSLTWLDGTRVEGAREKLGEFCDELLVMAEPEFQKMGILGLTSSYLRHFFRDPSVGITPLVDKLHDYTKDHFDDFELGGELAAAASTLFVRGKRDQAIELLSMLRDDFRQSKVVEMIGVADSLAAQVAMAEVSLDKLIAAQVVNEEKNLPALTEGVAKIISSGTTTALYNEMTRWLQFFEQQACYRSVDSVAAQLEEAFRKLPDDNARNEVLSSLSLIRKRMGLVGKPFEIVGIVDAEGNPFDKSLIAGKPVLLTFWTASATPADRQQLQYETKMYEQWRPRGLMMFGFSMDEDPNAAKAFFGDTPPRWAVVRSSEPSQPGYKSKFAQSAVADHTPYRILLNRDGTVVHVGVPVDRLAKDVDALLNN